jgi:isopenicillin-N N-acyltransferase-like protein
LRRGLRALVALSLLVAVLWLVMLSLMLLWIAREPKLENAPAILTMTPERRDGRVYLGANWFGQCGDLKVLFLKGSPFEMGYADGVLTQEDIHRQEDSIVTMLHRVAPHRWEQFILEFFVTFKNRRLAANTTPDLQLEILGIARGCPDTHPELGPYFNRIVNYHAAQDISYMLMNSPLIRRGCTAFGAWGDATAAHHLLCGRDFDWEADPVFDEDRILIFCQPNNGIPFVSLAWAGMAGCVSAMNEAGVSITVNGAPSHLPASGSTPTCLVAREVMEHAHNLAEATDIIRRRQVFVSAMFLVGSRADGKFVVVEKTPNETAVREPEPRADFLVCANHYLSTELKDDPINATYKSEDTSISRFDRLTELLGASTNALNANRCADILRDRRLPGDIFAGNGNRGSLNALIATHAVVMDLTDGIFWAAAPPHQLGKFMAFSLREPGKVLEEESLPADPMLSDGEYKEYLEAKDDLSAGRGAMKQGDLAAARNFAADAEKKNPGSYQNAMLLAEISLRQGKRDEATEECRRALSEKPALAAERRRIERLLAQATATP